MEDWIPFEAIGQAGPLGVVALLAILAASIAVLTKGADWFVEGSAQLAYRLGISKIIVGATVVSLGTTAPEAAVSVVAAIGKNSGLALGNAVGSVICNTGLIFGLGCVITSLPIDRFILRRHGWLKVGSGCLLVALAVLSTQLYETPVIKQWMGIVLLALLAGYMFISVRWSKQHPSLSEDVPKSTRGIGVCLLMVAVGIVLIVASAKCLVGSAKQLCYLIGVPESVISATLVAFGTSVPELATAMMSIRKGHPEILVGNIIGANILNVLFVIGASATAVDLPVPPEFFYLHFPVMMLMLLTFRAAISAGKTSFSRWWALPLLLFYGAYIATSYVLGLHLPSAPT